MNINGSDAMFTSKSDCWETPQDLFNSLNEKYHFELDVCADEYNHKCDKYYTREQDGLVQDWNGRCWMNPPYGRQIKRWIEKAYLEVTKGNAEMVCCLVPARTDTAWWHEYVMKGEIHFLRGRLHFSGQKNPAPFPVAVVIFKQDKFFERA